MKDIIDFKHEDEEDEPNTLFENLVVGLFVAILAVAIML